MNDYWDIYEIYCERVRRFIILTVKDTWVAEDLLQETFIRVQKNLTQLNDSGKLKSWIFRIAYNLCQDHFRQSKRISNREEPVMQIEILPHYTSAQKMLEQQQMSACVQEQTKLLPESLRTPLLLFEILEFKQQEIAEILNISVENTKVRLHRARKQMRAILNEKCRFEKDERNVLVCEPRLKK
ncbi:MAG: RNA polymerase sigma factor [Thermodesulfobacteriota bacterium]